jgi:AcrR family transcriptional regulator
METFNDIRRRGRRPADAQERRKKVHDALRELEATGIPFSMQDVAERVGVSRATLYRDTVLRELIGARGDSPDTRPVDYKTYARLRSELEVLRAEKIEIQKRSYALEKERRALQEKIQVLEKENRSTRQAQRRAEAASDELEDIREEAYGRGFQAGREAASRGIRGGSTNPLVAVAARLPRTSRIEARNQIAKLIHPDRFADNAAMSVLATEILKQLNALTDM